jgi:purine-binding chemotaxis protein CheW
MSKAVQEKVDERQFLTFMLNGQEYALEISKIKEIRGYSSITPVPIVPAHVRGVMNLRGTVLPVIDLRMKFGLPEVEYDRFTVIAIVAVGEKTVGLLVDAVSDVLMISTDSLRPAPEFGATVDTRFINGMFEAHERLVVALNLEQLLTETELCAAEAA